MTKFRHATLSLSLSLATYYMCILVHIYTCILIQQIYTFVDWCIWFKTNAFRCFCWTCSNIIVRRDLLIKKLVTHTSYPSIFVHLLLKESNGRLLEGHGVASLSNLFLPSHMGRCFVRKLQVTRSFPTQVLCVSGVPGQNPGGDQLGWWKYWSFGVSILTWKDSLMLVSYAVFTANSKRAPLVGSS